MAAYVITNVTVHDAEGYKEYARGTPDSIARFGGRFLVRGGALEVREGEWDVERLVVVEFPDMERARAWYESEEYQRLKAIREATSSADMVWVEGVQLSRADAGGGSGGRARPLPTPSVQDGPERPRRRQ